MNDVSLTEAVYDLARVVIATNGKFESKSEAVRKLNEFSIPPSRIATILAMKLNNVTSILAQDRKRSSKGTSNGEVDHDRV
jgi:hypothetical protein